MVGDKNFCDIYEQWKMNQVAQQQKEYYDSLEKKSNSEKSEGELWDGVMKEFANNIAYSGLINKYRNEKCEQEKKKQPTTTYDGKTTPPYYIGKYKKITAADVVADFELSYNCGSSVVYLLRAGKKPDNAYIQDLKKAVHHLNMEIEQHERK